MVNKFLQKYLLLYPQVGYIINNPNLIYKKIRPPNTYGGIILEGNLFIKMFFDYQIYNKDIYSILNKLNKYQQELFVKICNQDIEFVNSYKKIKLGKSIGLFKYENIPIYGIKNNEYFKNIEILNDLKNTNLSNFYIIVNQKYEIIKSNIEIWKLIYNSNFKFIKQKERTND